MDENMMGGDWRRKRNEVGLIEMQRADQHRAVRYTCTPMCSHGICSVSALLRALHLGFYKPQTKRDRKDNHVCVEWVQSFCQSSLTALRTYTASGTVANLGVHGKDLSMHGGSYLRCP